MYIVLIIVGIVVSTGVTIYFVYYNHFLIKNNISCTKSNEIVKPLCIILPQMNAYIKYFENGGKNLSFLIKNSEVWEKYEDIWNVIKNKLNIKFHSQPIYENKYLKAKVR